jgi:hypothetical protein
MIKNMKINESIKRLTSAAVAKPEIVVKIESMIQEDPFARNPEEGVHPAQLKLVFKK